MRLVKAGISMYYSVEDPNIFAASLLVGCHWNPDVFPELANFTFTFLTPGDSGKSFAGISGPENAARAVGGPYA